jgi:hypothetical protein
LEIGPVDFTLGLGLQLHLSYVAACVTGKWRQKDGPAHSNRDKVLHDPNLESSAQMPQTNHRCWINFIATTRSAGVNLTSCTCEAVVRAALLMHFPLVAALSTTTFISMDATQQGAQQSAQQGTQQCVQQGVCAGAPSQNPDLVVISEKLPVGRKRLGKTDEALESVHVPAKKRGATRKGKSNTSQAEENEEKKGIDRWTDEEAVALISLRGEMNDDFNRNLKKQGKLCTISVSSRFLRHGYF